jgi:hypothetical protein
VIGERSQVKAFALCGNLKQAYIIAARLDAVVTRCEGTFRRHITHTRFSGGHLRHTPSGRRGEQQRRRRAVRQVFARKDDDGSNENCFVLIEHRARQDQ